MWGQAAVTCSDWGTQLWGAGDQPRQCSWLQGMELCPAGRGYCTHGRAAVALWKGMMGFTPRLLSSASLSHLGASCSLSSHLLAHIKVLLVPRAPCFFRMEEETGE